MSNKVFSASNITTGYVSADQLGATGKDTPPTSGAGIVPALIRTIVPYVVGGAVSLLALIGVPLPQDAQTSVGAVSTFVLGSGYYAISLALQKRWPNNPVLKWLLGAPTLPVYNKAYTGGTKQLDGVQILADLKGQLQTTVDAAVLAAIQSLHAEPTEVAAQQAEGEAQLTTPATYVAAPLPDKGA